MKIAKLKIENYNGGFTLVETLVAISIFTVSISALFTVLSAGISHTNYAKQKMIATYLAQEGIEYVRNIRDTAVLYQGEGEGAWISFRNTPESYPAPNDFAGFTRTLSKNIIGPNEVKISSTVSWTQGSGNYNITFSESLFNWVE